MNETRNAKREQCDSKTDGAVTTCKCEQECERVDRRRLQDPKIAKTQDPRQARRMDAKVKYDVRMRGLRRPSTRRREAVDPTATNGT
jgi:hypothetical protein